MQVDGAGCPPSLSKSLGRKTFLVHCLFRLPPLLSALAAGDRIPELFLHVFAGQGVGSFLNSSIIGPLIPLQCLQLQPDWR